MSFPVAEASALNKEGVEFTFRVYRPEQSEVNSSDWLCKYSIFSTSTNIEHHMYGVSSLQALALALNIISVRAEIFGVDLVLYKAESSSKL